MRESRPGGGDGNSADTAIELVELLCQRHDILAELEQGSKGKRDLVANLDVSRSTVDRGLRHLSATGYVETSGSTYQQSLSGRLAATAFRECLASLAALSRAEELLALLPPTTPMSRHLIETAEVILAHGPAQVRPQEHVLEVMKSANELSGFVQAHTNPGAMDVFREQVTAGMTTELVFDRDVFDYLTTRYPERIADLFGLEALSAWRTESVPFGLFIAEEAGTTQVNILVHNDHALAGVLHSDHPAAVAWARNLFDEFRAEATKVPVASATDQTGLDA